MSVDKNLVSDCSGDNSPEQFVEECPYQVAIKHYSWYYFYYLKLEKSASSNLKDAEYYREKRLRYSNFIRAVKFVKSTGCSWSEAKKVFFTNKEGNNGN
tara:strand:+ start:1602 stop:1898 length:297 start_codon:yes stop_codon:yes gene_type:complete